MKYFASLYNSFLFSLLISLILFTNEWLEMRVNIGFIFLGLWALAFIILSILSRKKLKLGFIFSLSNLIIGFIIAFILYGLERLTIVPASIIREGLHITSISFGSINIVLTAFIIIGLGIVFIGSRKKQAV